MSEHPNHHVNDYLRRLEAATTELPRQRRAELIEEIREHVDQALREIDVEDEVSVRNVLERLGSPEEIAAAAGITPVTPEPSRGRTSVGAFEIATLAVLVLGGLLPVIGWLVGVAFISASGAWPIRDKAVGLLLSLLPTLIMMMMIVLGTAPHAGLLGPLEIAVLLALTTGSISALFLGLRLRQPPRLAH